MSMKHLPNILSSLRIVGAVALLLCDVVGTTFWSLYALSATGDIRHLPLTRLAIITVVVLYSLRALAGSISCIYDFRWLQFFSSLVPAIIAWCYWPGVKEKATMC